MYSMMDFYKLKQTKVTEKNMCCPSPKVVLPVRGIWVNLIYFLFICQYFLLFIQGPDIFYKELFKVISNKNLCSLGNASKLFKRNIIHRENVKQGSAVIT